MVKISGLERDEFSSNRHPALSFLFEHDLRANASRLSRGKTGTHPASSAGHAFPDHALEIELLDPAIPTMAFTFMQHSAGRAPNRMPAIAQFPPCSGLPRDAASVFIRGLAFGRLHACRPREGFRDAVSHRRQRCAGPFASDLRCDTIFTGAASPRASNPGGACGRSGRRCASR